MDQTRKDRIKAIEDEFGTKLLVYFTGDRRGLETQIHSEVLEFFVDHLDKIGQADRISLFLYTRGGNTLAGWSLVNLIRQFCEHFEVIVPSKCHSTGTLIALGAERILMTKQATLGPIDPSVTTPLNPGVPNNPQARVPVNVESIRGFLDLAREELRIKNDENLSSILLKLSDHINPLVLGDVYRAKSQIQMLARKLLQNQVLDNDKIDKIISFLVSESGSHDYTIDRREARDGLGLKVEKPNDQQYTLIKSLYEHIRSELELVNPLDFNTMLGANPTATYSFRRAVIESLSHGSHYFVSEGTLQRARIQVQPGVQQDAINDNRQFEGWRFIPL
jgi:hypothetical protein